MTKLTRLVIILAVIVISACKPSCEHVRNELRAPAYPLVTIDPFTSTWSAADNLYDAPTTHWTGAEHQLLGVVTVDGVPYRFLGQAGVEKKFIARMSDKTGWPATYTLAKPAGKWYNRDYDDSKWTKGEGGFGSESRKPMIHTVWDGPELWVRREFTIDAPLPSNEIDLFVRTNEYGTVYINGIKVCDSDKTAGNYIRLSEEVVSTLVTGKNIIAAYCANPTGSARLDVALAASIRQTNEFEQTATQLYADVQAMQTHYGFTCGSLTILIWFHVR